MHVFGALVFPGNNIIIRPHLTRYMYSVCVCVEDDWPPRPSKVKFGQPFFLGGGGGGDWLYMYSNILSSIVRSDKMTNWPVYILCSVCVHVHAMLTHSVHIRGEGS